MKKSLLFVFVLCLLSFPGQAQGRFSLAMEFAAGVGFADGPQFVLTHDYVALYNLAGGLKLGGGVGVRFAKPVTTLSKNNYYDSTHYDNEVDLPLFVRISYGKSRLTASLDAGYAFGLWSVYSKEAIPGGNRKPTYRGLFLEPQLGLRIGKDSVLSLGVLLQQTTDVLNLDNVLTPAATLRYSYYF